MLTRLLRTVLLITMAFISHTSLAADKIYPDVTVGVLVPLQHQAMDEIVAGFKTTLQKQYPGHIKFIVKNAQGDLNLQRAILLQFKQQKLALVAPIATGASQMTLSVIRSTPVVCIAAQINRNNQRATHNFTGVNDEIPVAKQLQFIKKTMPNLNKITLIHSAEDKIFPEVKKAQQAAKQHNIKIQTLMIQQLPDLYTVSQRIARDSDAIFILKDSLIVSGIRTLVKQAVKRSIPIISSDDGSVQQGAAFAIGVKERHIGEVAAQLAAQILTGKKANDIPYKNLESLYVFVNPTAIKQQGLQLNAIKQAAQQSGYQVITLNGLGA